MILETETPKGLSNMPESDFKFGKYVVKNDITLTLPENKIHYAENTKHPIAKSTEPHEKT